MQTIITKTTEYEGLLDDVGQDILKLTLKLVNDGGLRISIVHNGASHMAYINKFTGTPQDFIMQSSVEKLAGLMDPFGSLFNKLSPATLVETLNGRLDTQLAAGAIEASDEESLRSRIQQTVVASSLSTLHATFNDLMDILYGPNWVVLHAPELVGKSDQYLDMLKRISLCKQIVADEAGK